MTLMDIATSPWWIVLCAIACVSIYWDTCSPSVRRIVVALGLALVLSVGLSAAEVYNPDYCKQIDSSYAIWWLIPCW